MANTRRNLHSNGAMVVFTSGCNYVSYWHLAWHWFVVWGVLMDYFKPNFPEPIDGVSEKTRSMANVSDIYKHTGGNWQSMLAIMDAIDECLQKMVYARNKGKDFIHIAGMTTYHPPYPKDLKIMSGDFGQIIGAA